MYIELVNAQDQYIDISKSLFVENFGAAGNMEITTNTSKQEDIRLEAIQNICLNENVPIIICKKKISGLGMLLNAGERIEEASYQPKASTLGRYYFKKRISCRFFS